jgi:predicted hotdog family 3-hydroxylacyl-ACP dehydratase
MRLDRAWIEQHVPHRGRMCLLDEVRSWDAAHVECATRTHAAADHPLRAHARLGAGCALEYAAQAMAVHGALLDPAADSAGGFGLLTSAREVELYVLRLDDLAGELLVRAERLHAGEDGALYDFSLWHMQRLLAQGRASLWFGSRPPAGSRAPDGAGQ